MNYVEMEAMAKINLSLDVIGKRENGYHELKMIMQTIELKDKISFLKKEEEIGITLFAEPEGSQAGEISGETFQKKLGKPEDNLICRAVRRLMEESGQNSGMEIHLKKKIPVAAGLAGGSTDAAAAFKAANQILGLSYEERELMKKAVELGADIPYCILGGTALSEGIGEVLTPLPKLPPCAFLLVKPDIEVSTKWVYQNLKLNEIIRHPDVDGMIEAIKRGNLSGIAKRMENVLELVTVKRYPVIEKLKHEMKRNGALNAVMSGSGPTVFGLYANLETAKRAEKYFSMNYPEYEIYAVRPGYY